MQIVQTFWTGATPAGGVRNVKAGWRSPLFHYMSWALSISRLSKYYPHVQLYTNSAGRHFMEEVLQLPYASYNTALDHTPSFPPKLWALVKVYVYSLQQSPFIHVDGDFFAWKPLPAFPETHLVVQSMETKFVYNRLALMAAGDNRLLLPDFVVKNIYDEGDIDSVNAGVIGGDPVFFRDYAAEVFRFFETNQGALSQPGITNHINCLLEQVIFYCLAKERGRPVSLVLDQQMPPDDYSSLVYFEGVPGTVHYAHPVGDYKKDKTVCRQMAALLRQEAPHLFNRLKQLFKDDYDYWFEFGYLNTPGAASWENCRS